MARFGGIFWWTWQLRGDAEKANLAAALMAINAFNCESIPHSQSTFTDCADTLWPGFSLGSCCARGPTARDTSVVSPGKAENMILTSPLDGTSTDSGMTYEQLSQICPISFNTTVVVRRYSPPPSHTKAVTASIIRG